MIRWKIKDIRNSKAWKLWYKICNGHLTGMMAVSWKAQVCLASCCHGDCPVVLACHSCWSCDVPVYLEWCSTVGSGWWCQHQGIYEETPPWYCPTCKWNKCLVQNSAKTQYIPFVFFCNQGTVGSLWPCLSSHRAFIPLLWPVLQCYSCPRINLEPLCYCLLPGPFTVGQVRDVDIHQWKVGCLTESLVHFGGRQVTVRWICVMVEHRFSWSYSLWVGNVDPSIIDQSRRHPGSCERIDRVTRHRNHCWMGNDLKRVTSSFLKHWENHGAEHPKFICCNWLYKKVITHEVLVGFCWRRTEGITVISFIAL